MRIHVKVQVGEGYYGSGPNIEKEAEVRSEGILTNLPWEDICAGLVQSAIKEYKEAVIEAEED